MEGLWVRGGEFGGRAAAVSASVCCLCRGVGGRERGGRGCSKPEGSRSECPRAALLREMEGVVGSWWRYWAGSECILRQS